jgi:hypothetical protein
MERHENHTSASHSGYQNAIPVPTHKMFEFGVHLAPSPGCREYPEVAGLPD